MEQLLKISHTEPVSLVISITITGVGDPRHQHQRLCIPPHPHLCSSLYNASRRELSNDCTSPQGNSSVINVNHVISSIQHSSIHFDLLWSKFNAFSVTELNSTQHSSVMQLVPLNTAQLNSVRQLVSLSYHVFNPSRTN